MAVRVSNRWRLVVKMHNVAVPMDGADRFVLNHSTNAKVNHVTMVVLVSLDPVGFVACVHKDSRDPIAESM